MDLNKNRREGRLRVLKQDLVAQMLGAPGDLRGAVEEVRARWGVDNPLEELPPESDDILYPPSIGEPGSSIEEYTAWLNARRRWLDDLFWILLHCVPEEYLEAPLGDESTLQVGSPPVTAHRLPWLRFASTLVLYDAPPSAPSPSLTTVGLLSGLSEAEEPTLDVLTERQPASGRSWLICERRSARCSPRA